MANLLGLGFFFSLLCYVLYFFLVSFSAVVFLFFFFAFNCLFPQFSSHFPRDLNGTLIAPFTVALTIVVITNSRGSTRLTITQFGKHQCIPSSPNTKKTKQTNKQTKETNKIKIKKETANRRTVFSDVDIVCVFLFFCFCCTSLTC